MCSLCSHSALSKSPLDRLSNMEPEGEAGSSDPRNQQVDNAIRAIQEKKPLPEIDFTMHTMEDGAQVNTQERVCKGACESPKSITPPSPRFRHSPTVGTRDAIPAAAASLLYESQMSSQFC